MVGMGKSWCVCGGGGGIGNEMKRRGKAGRVVPTQKSRPVEGYPGFRRGMR